MNYIYYILYGMRFALPAAPFAIILGGFIALVQRRKQIRASSDYQYEEQPS